MNVFDKLSDYGDMIPTLTATIERNLRSDIGKRYFFREKTVIKEILIYLFKDKPVITDMNRFEWLHQLDAKASIIAHGWRINCAPHVDHYEDTYDSIVDYIEMTYGTHRRLYAA